LGKDKDLINILKKEGLKNDEVYYVADEIRDALACFKAKIKMIGVLWGVAGERGLTKVKVDHLIKKPEEILSLLPTQFRPKRSNSGWFMALK
jgi:phosphoglycolate phosphatase-like HAD superfamily hydrolase